MSAVLPGTVPSYPPSSSLHVRSDRIERESISFEPGLLVEDLQDSLADGPMLKGVERMPSLQQGNTSSAPIHRLPTELLLSIFTAALDEVSIRFRYRHLLQIALVCRPFHSVVNTSPALWSFVSSKHQWALREEAYGGPFPPRPPNDNRRPTIARSIGIDVVFGPGNEGLSFFGSPNTSYPIVLASQ